MHRRPIHRAHTFGAAALVIMLLTIGCARDVPPDAAPTGRQAFALASLRLPTPVDRRHQEYLGLPPGETFALADIRTRILVIEVFDLYCPHCQREAPQVNRLFQRIEDDAALRDRIKIIGIGIRNTSFEVDVFRKTYAVPFPLFADRARALSMQLDVRRTPTFIGWGYHAGGRVEPFLHAAGPIGDIDAFLKRLTRDSGIDLPPDE